MRTGRGSLGRSTLVALHLGTTKVDQLVKDYMAMFPWVRRASSGRAKSIVVVWRYELEHVLNGDWHHPLRKRQQ